MFDPFDQVRMRTQQLLATADRIREERALKASAQEDRTEAAVPTAGATVALDAMAAVAAVADVAADACVTCAPGQACAETPGEPGPARTRAA
jgi:hypothetical protein